MALFDNNPSVHVECFADDCALIITGKDIAKMKEQMQRALHKCEAWAKSQGLVFAPGKSEAIIFTRKYMKTRLSPRRLKLNGKCIDYVDVVRYLGVLLDSKLSFRPHLSNKVEKCTTLLNLLNSSMGRFWGIPPMMAVWAWRGVVRPALTFGSFVWGHILDQKWAQEKVAPVQLRAMRMITMFRRSSPRMGLDMITNTWPVDLQVKYLQVASWYRTKGFESMPEQVMYTPKITLKGHRQRIEEWLFSNDCGGQAMVGAVLDDIPEKFMWTKKYSVSFKSMNPHISKSYGAPWQKGDIEIYTDGSKDEDGMAGGGCAPFKRVDEGYAFAQNGGVDWNSFHLDQVSVFQAEMYSLFRGAVWAATYAVNQGNRIVLYTDNQAVVKALNRNTTRSELIYKAYNALNRAAVATGARIIVSWVKGHAGHTGNEVADKLANDGREDRSLRVVDVPKPPLSYVKSLAYKACNRIWNARWLVEPMC